MEEEIGWEVLCPVRVAQGKQQAGICSSSWWVSWVASLIHIEEADHANNETFRMTWCIRHVRQKESLCQTIFPWVVFIFLTRIFLRTDTY
jgi:hypothetical protein